MRQRFHRIYNCNNELYQISLTSIINYETFDITYLVTNESSIVFCGIVEVVSSMLGSNKKRVVFGVNEIIEFKGNLTNSIIYDGEFKQDTAVAYLRFPECNFVMSNTVKTLPEVIPPVGPQSWIYKVMFATLPATGNLKSFVVMNSLNSRSVAKDITVEVPYFFGINFSTIEISSDNEYSNEITLDDVKFTFNIPSLAPGQFRTYRFLLTPTGITGMIPILTRVKSSTPFLFQPEQDIIFRS